MCATLDWWPSAKCDYGRCPWAGASLLHADLTDPLLVNAARLLAPFYLRLGGSLSDSVTYEEEDGCIPLPAAPQLAEDGSAAAGGAAAGDRKAAVAMPRANGAGGQGGRGGQGGPGGGEASWECGACTYRNQSAQATGVPKLACDICATPRDS